MSLDFKTPKFPTYIPNIPPPPPAYLSITNQTWTPNQTTFKSMNFASQSFSNFPCRPSGMICEIKGHPAPASFGNETTKAKVSLPMPTLHFKLDFPPPPLFANGTLTADSFSKRKLEQSHHVNPDFPRYTATEKLFFQAFDSFSRWSNQPPPTSLVLPEAQGLPLSQPYVGSPAFNASPISFKADCWVQIKKSTDLQNHPITSIELKVVSVAIDFFDPLKMSITDLSHTERSRIRESTQQYEINVRESRERYMARKLSGDAERPLSRYVTITGKIGLGNSLEIDISRYSWGKSSNSLEEVFSNKTVSVRENGSNRSTVQSTKLPETRLDQLMQAFKEEFKEYRLRTAENCTRTFTTVGINLPNIGIGGINGILTGPEGADSHANYFTELAGGISINWTYNHTNGPLDIVEVFAMNYFGFSPNTSRELQNIWTRFHENHLDNPNIKYLHFCHSQGAIHTRNALVTLPQEICNRVIVVAIAPAAIVPKELCFNSFNYACKGDVVPLGQMVSVGLATSMESASPQLEELLFRYRNELILLDPIPGSGNRHLLQNEVFTPFIKEYIKKHLDRGGVYECYN